MVRDIVLYPASVLIKPCVSVDINLFKAGHYHAEVADLDDTLCANKTGIGLAANQIGISLRMFGIKGEGLFVNPVIVKERGQRIPMTEGCLSVPGMFGGVVRPSHIDVEYFDEKGEMKAARLSGMVARVFMHELDHLDGKMFFEKMDMAAKIEHKDRLEAFKAGVSALTE